MNISPQDSLIEYPSEFPLKIFGASQPDFAPAITQVVLAHAPDFDVSTMATRSSTKANYVCLTCTVRVTSREQLDNLYRDLTSHPMVKMVL